MARLTSAISSSLRTKRCSDQLLSDCGISAAGSVDADALPTNESPIPTAPIAVAAAALVVLYSLAAFFIRAIVVSFDTLLGSSWRSGRARTAYECQAAQKVPPWARCTRIGTIRCPAAACEALFRLPGTGMDYTADPIQSTTTNDLGDRF